MNTQTGEIIENSPMTVDQIMAHVALIGTVMTRVMKGGMHYGLIPGCGKKPTLLKPGAEKLSMVFKLRPIIKENSEDIKIMYLDNGHKDITVYCHVFNMAGTELATGVGSCSTMESKYRYRGGEKKGVEEEDGSMRPVPKEFWNLKKAGEIDEAQTLIGGPGFSAGKIGGAWVVCEVGEKMENADIADVYNTVLKIAKKRAYIDGILSATGASDTFTQDLEDLPDHLKGKVDPAASAPEGHAGKPAGPALDYKDMKAGFPSECPHCKKKIEKGAPIVYRTSLKKAFHPECFFLSDLNKDLKAPAAAADQPGDAQETPAEDIPFGDKK
jgi:hypothetical protein